MYLSVYLIIDVLYDEKDCIIYMQDASKHVTFELKRSSDDIYVNTSMNRLYAYECIFYIHFVLFNEDCVALIIVCTISCRSSHIFNEESQVTYALINIGLSSLSFVWWNEAPPFLLNLWQRNSVSLFILFPTKTGQSFKAQI